MIHSPHKVPSRRGNRARRSSPPPGPPMRARSSRSCPPPSACSTRRAATSSSAPTYVDPAAERRRASRSAEPVDLPAATFPGDTGQIFDTRLELQRRLQGGPQRPLLLPPGVRPAVRRPHDVRRGQLSVSGLSGDLRRHGDLAGHRGALLRRDPDVKVYRRRARAAVRRHRWTCAFPPIPSNARRGMGVGLSRRRRLRAARDRAAGGADLLLEHLLRSLDRREGRAVRERHAVTQHTTTDLETPQSVQLDFQTGVAPKTLVFGYVRWVDWTEFNVTPAALRTRPRSSSAAAADRELRGRRLDLQPRRRAPAHRQSRRLVRDHLRAGHRRRDADARAPTTARPRGRWR